MPTKKTSTQATVKKVKKSPVSEEMMTTPQPTIQYVESPYSLQTMIKFITNNMLLIILAIGLFSVGFLSGSLAKENQMLKAGGGTPSPIAPTVAGDQQAPPEAGPLSDADWKAITSDPVFVIGDKNAKLTMVEFTDYQCPFCSRYYNETSKQVIEKYVKNKQLKIVYKDQALPFHPNANSAAQAVRCAVEQGKPEAMHDQLFATQDQWSSLSGDAVFAKYGEMATTAGMNGQKLADCVKSGKHKAKVDADGALGQKVGAGGTPTFFIEKKPLVGAQPFSSFDTAIAELLK